MELDADRAKAASLGDRESTQWGHLDPPGSGRRVRACWVFALWPILYEEAKWTLETALDLQTATPVIALSLLSRYRSLDTDSFNGKVVAALRNEFGGHAVEKA